MKAGLLPNGDRAIVDIAKLTDYCLNPQHEDGKHKARVFASALGLGREDAEWNSLRDRLVVNQHLQARLRCEAAGSFDSLKIFHD